MHLSYIFSHSFLLNLGSGDWCYLVPCNSSNKYLCASVAAAAAAAAAAKSLQSCPTLCDPIDGSPPGSSVPGILQGRILEWVASSFSNAWKWKVKVKALSHAQLSGTPCTVAHQAPLSMGFSRQECWSGLPVPSLVHLLGTLFFRCWTKQRKTLPSWSLSSSEETDKRDTNI